MTNHVRPRIERSFLDVTSELLKVDEPSSFLAQLGWHGSLGWEALRKSPRVLIIAEAGTGKTHECRTEQKIQWDKGEPAFFVELAELARNNLNDLLGPEEQDRFDMWQSSTTETATFYLDSVDELKLTQGSFETALRRLAKELTGKLARTRIVITTRPISVDRSLIERHLPVPQQKEDVPNEEAFADASMKRPSSAKPDQNAAPTIRHVALMPLSNGQIREMAVLQGVADVDDLLSGIRQRNAEEFARRPQDLIDLCTDWKDHHRIRTHKEQVEYSIASKLKPRASSEGQEKELVALTAKKAWEGASRLALAALLTRKLTLRHSKEADDNGELGAALDPAKILTDWSQPEQKTLLERALFGFASYGRVRFHHRSVIEYLAAQRLQKLIERGMGIRAVKRLLFADNAQGVRVVKPTMRPVAAWLAATQSAIFSEVRDREPEVLLNHADPESLPADLRVDALRAYVEKHGKGKWRGLQVPQVQVHRFASNELGTEILRAWKTGIENPEVRALLLEIIATVPIQAGADIAYKVVLCPCAEHEERFHALDALIQLDDPRLAGVTESIELDPTLWPDRLLKNCIPSLFPDHIEVNRLCRVLSRIEQPANEVNWLSHHWIPSIANCEIAADYLDALRHGLTALVLEGVDWNQCSHYVRSPRQHLATPLAAACLRQINAGKPSSDVIESSVLALRLIGNDHMRLEKEPPAGLRTTIQRAPASVRSQVFWSNDKFNQRCEPQNEAWRRFYEAHDADLIDLNRDQDFGWIRSHLSDQTLPADERAVMLEAAMHCMGSRKQDWQQSLLVLKDHIADCPELIEVVDKRLAPHPVDLSIQARNARSQLRRQEETQRIAKDRESWIAFWRQIATDTDNAFSSEQAFTTAWDLWRVMSHSGAENRSSGWNRQLIEQHFNKYTADRLRSVMARVWRDKSPTLRTERSQSEQNTGLMLWQLGLAAIAAEAEDSEWATKLSAHEAKLAARYVPVNLNAFPFWFESLVLAHPEPVESVLWPELALDLDQMAINNSHRLFLQNVCHATKTVVKVFLPKLRSWLDKNHDRIREGENLSLVTERIQRVVELLLAHGTQQDEEMISAAAKKQIDAQTGSCLIHVWLPVLMQLNPELGTEILANQLQDVPPTSDGLGVKWIALLFGHRHQANRIYPRLSNFKPAQLLILVRLAYRHVRRADDKQHDGVFTPDTRDNAEDGRSALLNALLNAKGPGAWSAQIELANDPLFADFHDRFLMLCREKAAEELDTTALTEAQVLAMDRTGEAPPITRDDMFVLLMNRLDDIEELLRRDQSPREAWAGFTAERVMRRAIAHELDIASRNNYTVDQESVTADEKETDIRLRATSSTQQAVIELKLGDNRSGRDLFSTIQDQLVTRYMASETCRAGCLLVTVNADRHWEHPASGESLDVAGLRAMLTNEAERIVSIMGGQIRLTARVLDLRPRLAPGKTTSVATI